MRYLSQIRKGTLTELESEEFQTLISVTDIIETIADIITEDLVQLGHKRLQTGVRSSSKARDLLARVHRMLCGALEDAALIIKDKDTNAAESVIRRKSELYRLEKAILDHQEQRFQEAPDDRLEIFRIEMAFVEKQRQIYSLTKRIARTLIPRPSAT